ncbi:hypothetical protein [Haloquadratum walsbyi]|uniref:hypothetical protein n=1 Tax=Haloquadratum walsbyi TaxID=293091 RepID=UPI0011EA6A9C|nr:hypothetical protein [Haloquadratum walsbyi]
MDLPVKYGTAAIIRVLAILGVAMFDDVGIPLDPELLIVTIGVIPLYILYRIGRWVVGLIQSP